MDQRTDLLIRSCQVAERHQKPHIYRATGTWYVTTTGRNHLATRKVRHLANRFIHRLNHIDDGDEILTAMWST